MMQRLKNGFTLVELMTVIVIIGILASVIGVSVSSVRKDARDARRESDLHTLQSAIELYSNAHGGSIPAHPAWTSTSDLAELRDYMGGEIPKDPSTGQPYRYLSGPESDVRFSSSYVLEAVMEKAKATSPMIENVYSAPFYQTGFYSSGNNTVYHLGSGAQE